ncbi:hypothetical protein BURPS1106B_3139 [Burkholderia pseudomallei 1106b]|uniref:Uncharacterized protein n=1 Tax=Burkholderia pseudomallei (strain 1106a) TaxID=357348 RepID=A3P6W6_BURP0|nr:hypothetical protein BURPS1106A_A2043 [Burkholderia pseudomallei 1106a]EDU12770.1 hypothetical protein BURPS1655_D1715 [Burkholderia pseudomallei 1655]EEP49432.1 conserved hypothetical protein [Burkholderia pseudomallei MSHR346]EES20723.1 hypothetical protein BURPS1106B_3139 [Burkholderia pseudomallei 1106b]VUD63306.1 unnamed protein product [Burkholderia pseudomallei]
MDGAEGEAAAVAVGEAVGVAVGEAVGIAAGAVAGGVCPLDTCAVGAGATGEFGCVG